MDPRARCADVPLMAVVHDIRDVQIEPRPEGYVVRCGCGWESPPADSVKQCAEIWQLHRSGMEA